MWRERELGEWRKCKTSLQRTDFLSPLDSCSGGAQGPKTQRLRVGLGGALYCLEDESLKLLWEGGAVLRNSGSTREM